MSRRADRFARLPATLQQRLRLHCAIHGEDPAAVVVDAVMLHLDALEGEVIPAATVAAAVRQQ